MRAIISGIVFYLFAVLTAAASISGLAGTWTGVWTRDGDALPVTMTFAKKGPDYTGSFDSDALQVTAIPLNSIRDANGKIHFEIEGDQSRSVYDGARMGDVLSGVFSDGDAKGTFSFSRAKRSNPAVLAREVTFKSRLAQLSGTLILPTSIGRHRAVLCLHGSGPEGRWANRYLAQKFADAGIVALIYDKEGVGRSTGDWRKAGFDILADDAVAGIAFLRSLPEVDAARVGIYGHSQGGTIAPMIAERVPDIGFVIASAAVGTDPAEVEIYSVSNAVGIPDLPTSERADADSYVRTLVDVAYRGADRSPLDVAAARYKSRSWYFDPPPPDDVYWLLSRQHYQPPLQWRQVKAPVLLVYGAHDERVPPLESIAAITAALKKGGNNNLTVKLYPDADHTFVIVEKTNRAGWPRHEPDYATTLTNWVKAIR
jgi:uncharacterized protein